MKKKAIPEDVLDYFRQQGARGASAAARAAKKKATKKGA